MSKEKNIKQMSLLEDSHANHSQSQEKEKEQTMTATSRMKLLESLPNVSRGGLLEKMLRELLTSTMAWYSDRCKLTWKSKVSKSNVLLFQLQASVLGIKGKESGFLHTPTATEIGMRSPEAMEKRKKYRESIGRKTVPPGNLLEQIHMMYPSPRACEMEGGVVNNVQIENGSFSRVNKKGVRFGVKLKDAVHKMYGTPRAQDCRAALTDRGKGNFGEQVHQENNAKEHGGRLNPEFVEFLMGYPQQWTKIEPTE